MSLELRIEIAVCWIALMVVFVMRCYYGGGR